MDEIQKSLKAHGFKSDLEKLSDMRVDSMERREEYQIRLRLIIEGLADLVKENQISQENIAMVLNDIAKAIK